MSNLSTSFTTQKQLKQHFRPRDLALLFVSSISMVLIGVYHLNLINNLTVSYFLHLISLLPVISMAYFFGVPAGVMGAGIFSSLLLLEIPFVIQLKGFTFESIERVGVSLLLFISALVIGDLSTSVRQRTLLRLALKSHETLLSQALNLEEITRITIEQIHKIIRVQQVCVLLQNPITRQWQVYTIKGRAALRTRSENEYPTLGNYILSQNESFYINNLDAPDSILLENFPQPNTVNSILSRLLYNSSGNEIGYIVLINKLTGYFYDEDIGRLNELLTAVEKAIEQAYRYTRTDYALERQISQLSTIQRTSQVLNNLLDAEKVVELTLSTALDITQAESGVIWIKLDENLIIQKIIGDEVSTERTTQILQEAISSLSQQLNNDIDLSLPFVFKQSASQLSCTITHGKSLNGIIIVESNRVEAFDRTSQWVLSLLADHAATSLANVRLFQEISKEKQQTSLIIESITDGLITINRNGTILSANPAAQEQLGQPEKDIIGTYFCETLGLSTEICAQFYKELQKAWENQSSFNLELVPIQPHNSKRRIVNISAAPVFEENTSPSRAVILLRDITEREELNRLQEEMISSISHEMRTPLTKIQSISDLITSSLERNEPIPDRKYLDTLSTESQRLSQFLDRILDVHQLETHQFQVELRPLPLTFIVENLIEEWRIIVPRRRIEFVKPKTSVWVMADENALNSILSNLIDNAVKYSPQHSEIRVELSISNNKTAEVSVIDFGPGIEPEKQSLIFNRFYRATGGDSQEVYGHGIGLYVAKMLTESLGGKIWVESKPGEGSCFRISLPIMEATHETQNHND
ncbi:MAG: ATP-binding protein [Chloroflexota bacterium]